MKQKILESKTLALCEDAINRFQQNGFINGQDVKIKKDAFKYAITDKFSDQIRSEINALIKADQLLKISYIKSNTSDMYQTNINNVGMPDNLWADCCIMYAPGMFKGVFTLPLEILEPVYPDNDAEGYVRYSKEKLVRPNPDPKDDHIGSEEQTKNKDSNRNLTTKNTNLIQNKVSDGRSQVKKPIEQKPLKDSVSINKNINMLSEAYDEVKKQN